MSDFIFSVNVTFPIFLVMVIGWVLHQIGMLDEHFVTVANRFNFKVTLPFMLFRDIASVEISKVFDLKFVLYCAIVSVSGASGGSVNLRSKMTVSVVRLYSLRSEAVQPSWEWHLSTIFTDLLPWVR